jgi:hypothetical protein
MEVQINQEVIDTVCNSLRNSQRSLRSQLRGLLLEHKLGSSRRTIIESQLAEVEEALKVFQNLES